jgi:hypothetical protein
MAQTSAKPRLLKTGQGRCSSSLAAETWKMRLILQIRQAVLIRALPVSGMVTGMVSSAITNLPRTSGIDISFSE